MLCYVVMSCVMLCCVALCYEPSAAVPLNVLLFLLFVVAVVMSAASPLSQCVVLCYVVLCCVVL